MLIGLTGLAGSGKDTAYGFIAEWAAAKGLTPRRDAFADRLKVSAARAIGYSGPEPTDFCDGLKEPGVYIEVIDHGSPESNMRLAISGRQYLQLYGTEAHREVFGHDFWVNQVMDTYRRDEELLVVTDVRFSNEALAIRAYGGEIWRLVRPSVVKCDTHASEQGLPPDLIDKEVLNVFGLDYLNYEIRSMMEAFTH